MVPQSVEFTQEQRNIIRTLGGNLKEMEKHHRRKFFVVVVEAEEL